MLTETGIPQETVDAVMAQGWVIWVITILLLLALISQRIPGILGGFGTAWKNWVDNRRNMEYERLTADAKSLHDQIASLHKQNQHLQRQVNSLYAQLNAFQRLAVAHIQWDWRVLAELQKIEGVDIGPPPALFQMGNLSYGPSDFSDRAEAEFPFMGMDDDTPPFENGPEK